MVARIDALQDEGIVARTPDPDHRRRNVVTLTPSGRQTLTPVSVTPRRDIRSLRDQPTFMFGLFRHRHEPQPGDLPALASIIELSTPRHGGWVERSDAERAVGDTIGKGSAKSSQTLARLCQQNYLQVERRQMYAGRYQCYLPTPHAYETLQLPSPAWRAPAGS